LGAWDIAILVSIIIAVIVVIFYFLHRWAGRRMAEQQDMVTKHKQTATMYIIDKKKDKVTNAHFPKAITSQMPRMSRLMKMPLVKAKVCKEIMTLMCDASVFDALPLKKTVTVDVAGAYIVGMKGLKTKAELEKDRKARRKSTDDTADSSWSQRLLARFKR